jgi:hypothetical protein
MYYSHTLLEKKTDISENTARSKDTISNSQQTLDDGDTTAKYRKVSGAEHHDWYQKLWQSEVKPQPNGT